MKVLKRDKTNDFKIQIEDWSEDYSFKSYGDTLVVFQSSKEDISKVIKRHENTRFEFTFKNHDEALKAFDELLNGIKKPIDYAEYLYNPHYKVGL